MPEPIDFDAALVSAMELEPVPMKKRVVTEDQLDMYYARFPRIRAETARRGGPTVEQMFFNRQFDEEGQYSQRGIVE